MTIRELCHVDNCRGTFEVITPSDTTYILRSDKELKNEKHIQMIYQCDAEESHDNKIYWYHVNVSSDDKKPIIEEAQINWEELARRQDSANLPSKHLSITREEERRLIEMLPKQWSKLVKVPGKKDDDETNSFGDIAGGEEASIGDIAGGEEATRDSKSEAADR